jgi:hypothetical protein
MANDDVRGFEPQEEIVLSELSRDATPLCQNCLQPVNPHDYFCPHCNSNDAVNPMATYLPLLDLRFMYGTVGKLWHQILYGRMSLGRRLLLATVMVITIPATLPFLIVPTLYYGGIAGRPINWRVIWFVFVFMVVACLVYLAIAHVLA